MKIFLFLPDSWICQTMWWTPNLFICHFSECFVTELAFKGLLSSVNCFMFFQFSWLNKFFITKTALERSVISVSVFMSFQMWWILKSFITNFTLKRPFTGMNIFMAPQTAGIVEFFLTVFTRMFFVTILDMFLWSEEIWINGWNTRKFYRYLTGGLKN